MSVRNLHALFQPASVALIGASDRPHSVGAVLFQNLLHGGFKGLIWPVNPKHKTVGGHAAWPDVESLPSAPDLAVICTPPQAVPSLIAALGRKGTRAVIVITAGLKQHRSTSGETLEQAMLNAAKPFLLRILGPNCIGALVPGIGLNASFAPGNALVGPLAFVTQSGALATAMLDWANSRQVGFSHFISLGDSADVDFGDVLDYLASDSQTRAILMYAESVKSGRKFMSAARAAARNKPVIVVKAGRAPEGAKAAASHTGALAGSDAVFDAVVRRAGMLRVDSLEALFDAAETLVRSPSWSGERLAILTNGGGVGVLAADALAMHGGKLAGLSDDTLAKLNTCLPPNWSHGNPIDIIGDAPVARYQSAMQVLLDAPEVDALLFMHAPTAIVPSADIAAACLPMMQASHKLILTSWLGGAAVADARLATAAAGIPSYETPERTVAGWLQCLNRARNLAVLEQVPDATLEDFQPDTQSVNEIYQQALRVDAKWLNQAQAHALLKAYGIPTLDTRMVTDEEAAVSAANQIGYPVALKIVSPQIVHKSDIGGVVLGLASAEEIKNCARHMLEQVRRLRPEAQVLGFTVQAMAKNSGAHELIIGINSDPVFGPVILLGSGGTSVELHRDHIIALPPLNATLAQEMLAQSSSLGALLSGYRGRASSKTPELLSTLMKVSQMACDLPWLAELDINPLWVSETGVLAVDARVRLQNVDADVDARERHRLAIRPYPSSLEQSINVSGVFLHVRPIRPEDAHRMMQFYALASPEDMRLRFFISRRAVPTSQLARFTQIDYDREMSFIALETGSHGEPVMVGEVRALCDPDNLQAEFAIMVAADWQRKGLGRILLKKMVDYLSMRGTGELTGQCLVDNDGMKTLARELGFTITSGPDSGVRTMSLALAAASAGDQSLTH